MEKRKIFLFSFFLFILSSCLDTRTTDLSFVETSSTDYLLADAKPSNDPINFDTYETALVKRFVPLLIKGRPETSRLYIVVDNSEMPIDGSLSQKEIDFIGQWIEICAPKYEPEQLPDECHQAN